MGRLIIPSLGTGVRIPYGVFTFEIDIVPIGPYAHHRTWRRGTRQALSPLPLEDSNESSTRPDNGELEKIRWDVMERLYDAAVCRDQRLPGVAAELGAVGAGEAARTRIRQ